jgi:hypothetical protein
MEINLKNTQIYLISLPEDGKKRSNVLAWCKKMGFLEPIIVPGIRADPYWVGLSQAHYNAITLGANSKKPFIVMEDDAFPNYRHDSYIISIPDNTDAVYLGASIDGVDYENPYTYKDNGALFADLGSGKVFKAVNTLTTHALLYVDMEYSFEAARVALKSLLDQQPVDCAFAYSLLPNYNVYFLKPFFYQNDLIKNYIIPRTKNLDPMKYLTANF